MCEWLLWSDWAWAESEHVSGMAKCLTGKYVLESGESGNFYSKGEKEHLCSLSTGQLALRKLEWGER